MSPGLGIAGEPGQQGCEPRRVALALTVLPAIVSALCCMTRLPAPHPIAHKTRVDFPMLPEVVAELPVVPGQTIYLDQNLAI